MTAFGLIEAERILSHYSFIEYQIFLISLHKTIEQGVHGLRTNMNVAVLVD